MSVAIQSADAANKRRECAASMFSVKKLPIIQITLPSRRALQRKIPFSSFGGSYWWRCSTSLSARTNRMSETRMFAISQMSLPPEREQNTPNKHDERENGTNEQHRDARQRQTPFQREWRLIGLRVGWLQVSLVHRPVLSLHALFLSMIAPESFADLVANLSAFCFG